jgi:hypothetical protein
MPICARCRLPVPEDKLRLPDRCLDRQCPLNAQALAQRIAEETAAAERAAHGQFGAGA